MQAPHPPPQPAQQPASYTQYVPGESWWDRDGNLKIIDILHAFFYEVLGDVDVASILKTPTPAPEDATPKPPVDDDATVVERLVKHPKCDAAILAAFKLMTRTIPDRTSLPANIDTTTNSWKEEKRKIVTLLLQRTRDQAAGRGETESGRFLPPLNHQNFRGGDRLRDPFTSYQRGNGGHSLPPVNPAGTQPSILPSTQELLAAAPTPMSMPTPAESDIATTPRVPGDLHPNVLSPADSIASAASTTRRRRSSSSVTDSMRSPSKRPRARGPQEHQCPHCGKTFPFKSKLNDHMRIHEQTKNFTCPTCNKGFKRSREVAAHTKAVHKNQHHGNFHSLSPDVSLRTLGMRPTGQQLPVGGMMPHNNPQPFSMPTPMADSPQQMHSIASPAVKQEHTDMLAAFSMPTPQTTDPTLTNLPPPAPPAETNETAPRPATDKDIKMRNASPGDGRVVVKPIYQPETETQPPSAPEATSAPELALQSAPVAPMTNTAEAVPPQQPAELAKVPEPPATPKSAVKDIPNDSEPQPEAPAIAPEPTEVSDSGTAAEKPPGLVTEKDIIDSPTGEKVRKSSHSSDSSTSIHLSPKDSNPLLHPYETGEFLFSAGDGP